MSETATPVAVERDGAVGILRLNRPARFNCLSLAVIDGLRQGLETFERDASVRCVLIGSSGKHFCTGADLDEVQGLRAEPAALARFIDTGHAALERLEASPLPVVAAVQGLCLAGGLELMLACDVVIAAAGARFGDQHAQFGLIPGWGGTQRLPRVIGPRRAMDLFYSARWISAAEAQAWGLVNQVAEDERLFDTSLEYCRGIAGRSRGGLATMKRLARSGLDTTLAEGLAMERSQAVAALLAADVTEGLAAFQDRRQPRFS